MTGVVGGEGNGWDGGNRDNEGYCDSLGIQRWFSAGVPESARSCAWEDEYG